MADNLSIGEGHTYDPATSPPSFGHALKKYWAFEKDYINLNHGSYGSQPLPVFAESARLQLLSEQNPDKFHRKIFAPLLTEARGLIADLIGADLDEVVFVPNTSHGMNTILRNIEWREGDIILETSVTYGSVANTIEYLCDRSEQPRPVAYVVELAFPMTHQQIIDAFRARVRELKQLHSDRKFTYPPGTQGEGNRFVVVIDAITSLPGVVQPWKDLVKICKEEGLWSIVDAAHVLGQQKMNVSEVQPDFLCSNAHKWLYTKRSSAILYVPYRNQAVIKSSIPSTHAYTEPHPIIRSGKEVTPFVAQHEWTATLDQSPYLSATPAIKFRQWLGGEAKINEYCHDLAVRGGDRVAGILGTKTMDESGELTANMTNILLPLPMESPGAAKIYTSEKMQLVNATILDRLLVDHNISAFQFFHAGSWWVRACAQVYNEISDFEALGKALEQICKEIEEKHLP